VACVGVIALRPFRLRYDLPLVALGIAVNGVLVVFSIFALRSPRLIDSSVTFTLLVLQIVLQVVKMMLRLWNLRLETLLAAVPTDQLWSIGCSASSEVHEFHEFTKDDDVYNILALSLMDGRECGRHDFGDLVEDDDNPRSQLLEVIRPTPVYHRNDVLMLQPEVDTLVNLPLTMSDNISQQAATRGDETSSDTGTNELELALGSLGRVEEELRLHDELRLWRSR
jgi:hypothetical protein